MRGITKMNLIDILDLYAWEHDTDDLMSMLDSYSLDERLDRQKLNMAIISRHGAMRCISNTPEVMKTLLNEFFDRYAWNIKKLVDTVEAEYNPIDDYTMHREYHEDEHRESDADVINTDTVNRSTEDKVSAYDSTEYQPKDYVTVIAENGGTSDIDSVTETRNDQITDEHGNTGRFSKQELLEKERRISEFNIYNWILDTMKRELFILVY